MKDLKHYEVRVTYVVYNYIDVNAKNEEEAKDMAERVAASLSLDNFSLQETTTSIESVGEPMDADDMGNGEYFNGMLHIHFKYNDKNYNFRIEPTTAIDDEDIEQTWYIRLHPKGEDNIAFVLMGHYCEDGEHLSTDAPLMIRVEDNSCDVPIYIDDIDIQ